MAVPDRRSPRPSRKKPRATYHHGDLRRALLDRALEAIAEIGPERLSLRDLARRAGVSAAAPYRHFRDKDDLVAELAGECAGRLLAAMAEAIAGAGDDPLLRFQATGIAQVRFALANPAHFRIMGLPGVRARMPAAARERLDGFYEGEERRLVEAQRRGLVAPIPIDVLTLAARSLVNGLSQLLLDERPALATDVEAAAAVARAVTGVLGRGVLPRGPDPSGRRPG